MQLETLPLESAALLGFTHRVVVTHADLTQATVNTAQVLPILSVPAGSYVRDCAIHMTTAFKDTSDAAFNTTAITIGDDGDAARLLASCELNVNGTEVFWKGTVASKVPYIFTADNTIDITFASMADKALVDIDAGELVVFLNVANLANK